MENLPKKIYLNIGTNQSEDFKELSEVTWSQDRIGKDCVEYVLGSEHQARQQPVRKTLDGVKDEVQLKINELIDRLVHGNEHPYNTKSELLKLYASQAKAVEPQEGWVSIKDRMPEENQLVDIWKHDSYRDDWFRQINVIYKDEHICEFSHWMPSFLPPTQTNN